MSAYELLAQLRTRAVLRVAGLVWLALALRLIALPLAVVALLAHRLVVAVDTAITTHPAPPSPPRWAAANTRTRTHATV